MGGLLMAALVAAGTQVAVQGLAATPAAASIGANLYTATSASNSEPVKSAAPPYLAWRSSRA